jgi:vacuolar-type H+-ATPase subunit F/Vma7
MAPVRVIARHPAALGFALAGVSCIEARDGDEAAAAIARLSQGPAAGGVFLVEDVLADALPASMRRQLARDGVPIIMPFPSPALDGTARPAEDDLLELLRRAIGYRVRLR